jgi:methyl-accepting chemotaxis protein
MEEKKMSFIDDLKVGKKILGGFLLIVMILAMVSVLSYIQISTMEQQATQLYDQDVKQLVQLQSANSAFQEMRGNVLRYLLMPTDRVGTLNNINAQAKTVDDEIAAYKQKELSSEEKAQLALLETGWASYQAEAKKIMAKGDANDAAAVTQMLTAGSNYMNARKAFNDPMIVLEKASEKAADDSNKALDAAAANAITMLIISTILAAIIAIVLALYLAKSITGPVDQVAENLKELSKGHLGNRLRLSRKDEIGDMANVMDQFSDDLQNNVIGTMKMIAEGDLSANLKPKDAQDEITPAMINTINSLHGLVSEAGMLSKAAVEGRLATRGNADKFKGGYRDIVSGVNQTLDAVVGPVNEAMRMSNEFAKGNFTARVDEKLNVQGDFVKFKEALNNIGIEVSKSLSVVNQQVGDLAASAEEANASVEEVSAGSAQVAKNASGVSVNSEKATQGIEQVQKAMEDLSRTIQDVATKSELVAKIVHDTTTFSKEGMELAQKTEQGMQGITKSSNDVNQIIGEIKDQMDKISEIVNLITDLANQTNLLALNAAIEAARAGDAGRGFAVVATEVKSLAVESRASAERIAEMIDNLQKQTVNAVDAVTSANKGVKEGSEALVETLSSFNKIVSSIDMISQNVSEVAAAAEEQAASVEEVTASVNEVSGLMQDTTREATDAAAASEESSAAIDQITKVVANVNTIVDKVTKEVSRFRV